MTKRHIEYVCEICGSNNVTSDATAAWNIETQQWEICGVMDSSGCNNCGADDPRLIEVSLL